MGHKENQLYNCMVQPAVSIHGPTTTLEAHAISGSAAALVLGFVIESTGDVIKQFRKIDQEKRHIYLRCWFAEGEEIL